MTLSQKHRTSIYRSLTPILGEEEAEALLSHFPDRDDELVTRHVLRAELADLRSELKGDLADVRGELTDLRSELKGDLADVRGELADLRSELKGDLADVRGEIGELRVEMHTKLREHIIWTVGAVFAAVTLAVTLSALVR